MGIHYIDSDYGIPWNYTPFMKEKQLQFCSYYTCAIEKRLPIYMYRETDMKMKAFDIFVCVSLAKIKLIEVVVRSKVYLVIIVIIVAV